MWPIIPIFILVLYLFLRKDINNYFYTRNVFKLNIEDSFVKITYGVKIDGKDVYPRMTKLGVFYFPILTPVGVDDIDRQTIISSKIKIIDEIFMFSNMDGIIEMDVRPIGNVNEGIDDVYLVKFVPLFNNFKLSTIGFALLISTISFVVGKWVIVNYDVIDKAKQFFKFL